MSIWAKLKNIVGLDSDQPPTPSDDERVLSLLESSATIDPYVKHLRVLWLNGHQPGSLVVDNLMRRMEEKFPDHDALNKLLRGLYCSGKVEFDKSPLCQYAASLIHTTNYAFEGCLYRLNGLLQNSQPRQAISLAMRSVLSERVELDLLRWRFVALLKESMRLLYQASEKELTPLDGGVALLLGSMHMRVAQELISRAWNERVSGLSSSTGERIRKEEQLLGQLRSELLQKAQENIARGALNPQFVFRCRVLANLSAAVDVLPEYERTLLRSRVQGNKVAGIYNLEQRKHQGHLKCLAARLKVLREQYDGCIGLLEMDAEDAVNKGHLDSAVQTFKGLLRRKPSETYYAYRVAQVLEGAGKSTDARPFWIHCARTPGLGWRSTFARISAQAREFEYEADTLRSLPAGMVSLAAEALAKHLEGLASESWSCHYWYGAYAMGAKASALYHLAAQRTRNSETRKGLIQKAADLYTQLDETDGLKKIEGPAPETVFEPINIPFGVVPV